MAFANCVWDHFFFLGSLTPSARSIFEMIWGFGTAFPFSYSCTVFGGWLMAFANCVWDHFLACRPCWITFRMSEETVFSRPASVCASSLAAFLLAPLWFAPPNFFIVSTFAPARIAALTFCAEFFWAPEGAFLRKTTLSQSCPEWP